MKKNKFYFLLALILLITLFITVTLTSQSNIPAPRDVDGTVKLTRPIVYEKGKYSGTFIDSLTGNPKTFNESVSSDAYTSDIITRTAPYLFDLNLDDGKWNVFLGDHSKGNTGPGYDIEVLDDGSMEVTVYLRKDIYWTDGTRMTADDWVFYFNEIICNEDILHPTYGATLVETEDGDEIQTRAEKINRWTFKKIYARTLGEPERSTNFNIMPRHILKSVLDSQGPDGILEMWGIDTPVSELIGYGAWVIESFNPSESIIMKRNDRFFFKDEWNNRLPYLNKYTLSIVADSNAALLKFQNKELDILGQDNFIQTEFKTIVENSEATGYTVWNGGYESSSFFLTFNQNPNSERMKGRPQLNWFKDKNFRHAMNHLIDRETIVVQAYKGLAEPADTLLTKASPFYDSSIMFDNSYNPKAAMQLLEEMGMRDRNGDGILEDTNGEDVGFELITYNDLQTTTILANILVNEWQANGIDAQLTQVDFQTLMDITGNSQNWEATIYAIGFGLSPVSVNVWPSDGNLHAWYPNQEEPATEWEVRIDELHDEAMYEPDFDIRKELWSEMYSILYDELPVVPLVRRYKFMAVYNEWGNIYWDFYASVGDSYSMRLYKK